MARRNRPVKIIVRERGVDHAAAHFIEIGNRGADVRPVRDELRPIFQREERYRFQLNGPRWKKLSQETIDQKEAKGLRPEILRATGQLERSLVTARGEAELHRIHFGTDVWYARFHQGGTKRMPKRPLIKVTKAARAEMVGVMEKYVAVKDGRAGLHHP